jgi:hypothetical protein
MNKREAIIEQYGENEELIFVEGFDEAIIGVNTEGTNIIYSFSKGLEILEETMESDDALDYFYFNVENLKGEYMPIWVYDHY